MCSVQAANVGSNPAQKPANPARDDVSDLPNPFSGNPINEAATKVCWIHSSTQSIHHPLRQTDQQAQQDCPQPWTCN